MGMIVVMMAMEMGVLVVIVGMPFFLMTVGVVVSSLAGMIRGSVIMAVRVGMPQEVILVRCRQASKAVMAIVAPRPATINPETKPIQG